MSSFCLKAFNFDSINCNYYWSMRGSRNSEYTKGWKSVEAGFDSP